MPVTGRRHQIRVHLAWTGHAIVGDPQFTRKTDPVWPRTHLHAQRIECSIPSRRPRWQEVTAVPDAAFWAPLTGAAPTGAHPLPATSGPGRTDPTAADPTAGPAAAGRSPFVAGQVLAQADRLLIDHAGRSEQQPVCG